MPAAERGRAGGVRGRAQGRSRPEPGTHRGSRSAQPAPGRRCHAGSGTRVGPPSRAEPGRAEPSRAPAATPSPSGPPGQDEAAVRGELLGHGVGRHHRRGQGGGVQVGAAPGGAGARPGGPGGIEPPGPGLGLGRGAPAETPLPPGGGSPRLGRAPSAARGPEGARGTWRQRGRLRAGSPPPAGAVLTRRLRLGAAGRGRGGARFLAPLRRGCPVPLAP